MVRPSIPDRPAASSRGFTLLELLVVMTIIGILASIAVPALIQMPRRAKEAVLKTNLRSIREALEQYLGDKGQYPSDLSQLSPKYLKHIPWDPFTKSNEDWVPVYESEDGEGGDGGVPGPPPEPGQEGGPGIMDIHSASTEIAIDGTKYADW